MLSCLGNLKVVTNWKGFFLAKGATDKVFPGLIRDRRLSNNETFNIVV